MRAGRSIRLLSALELHVSSSAGLADPVTALPTIDTGPGRSRAAR